MDTVGISTTLSYSTREVEPLHPMFYNGTKYRVRCPFFFVRYGPKGKSGEKPALSRNRDRGAKSKARTPLATVKGLLGRQGLSVDPEAGRPA